MSYRPVRQKLPTFWSMLDAETQAYLNIAGVTIPGSYREPLPQLERYGMLWAMQLPSPRALKLSIYSLEYWKATLDLFYSSPPL